MIVMRKIYLLTTSHLEKCLWFRDEEDYRVAMNYVAIQAACCPEVVVLAFVLMSNHVHFVLRGRERDETNGQNLQSKSDIVSVLMPLR